jgi:hypothetical protein
MTQGRIALPGAPGSWWRERFSREPTLSQVEWGSAVLSTEKLTENPLDNRSAPGAKPTIYVFASIQYIRNKEIGDAADQAR